MSDLTATYEPLGEGDEIYGGRSLTVRYVSREVDPTCDPLGPDNKLFLATNIFTGVRLATANGRLSFGSKSPLTKTIKEASVGGTAGTFLVKQGIKVVAIEGCPANEDDLYYVHIDADGNVSIEDANEFKGVTNYPLVAAMQERYTENISVICGGVAGEKKALVSAIMVTNYSLKTPTRAAARGGLGAIMAGTKRIKAIVIEKPNNPYEFEFANEDQYRMAAKTLAKSLELSPNAMTRVKYGTLAGMSKNNVDGILPVRNFSGERFEFIDDVNGEKFYEILLERGGQPGMPCCAGCVVKCSQNYVDKEGNHMASGVQYETAALCGANLNIHDFDTLARITRACDEYGVDTIEIGAALGVLMQAGEIEWGSEEQVLQILDEMIEGTERGSLLLLGLEELGKRFPGNRLPHVLGQAFPGYDPRGSMVHGLAFIFGTQGADLTLALPPPGIPEDYAEVALTAMKMMAAVEGSFCLLAAIHFASAPASWDYYLQMMSGLYGGTWTMDRMLNDIGKETVMKEKEFNKKAGVTAGKLPDFLRETASESTGKPFSFPEEVLESLFLVNY
jgi:aldehyde:ferredoxin oxidoreductase